MKVFVSNNSVPPSNNSNYGPEPSFMPNSNMPHPYYSDDLNTNSVASSNDYVYKESYNYMLNPAEGNSIDEFSPTRSPYTLQVIPPHFQGNQGIPQNSQPVAQNIHHSNLQIHKHQSQPQSAIQHEQHRHQHQQLPQRHHLQQRPSQVSSRLEPQHPVESIQIPSNIDVNQYPDMTTLFNSNSSILLPPVESQFVDHKACNICGKRITRDMSRHMRTHQSESRFTCNFPKSQCRHKTGKFNRPYDFKKHLLNRHFKFDNPCIKRLHNLSDKLEHWGTCPCGARYKGKDWLDDHILTHEQSRKCCFVD